MIDTKVGAQAEHGWIDGWTERQRRISKPVLLDRAEQHESLHMIQCKLQEAQAKLPRLTKVPSVGRRAALLIGNISDQHDHTNPAACRSMACCLLRDISHWNTPAQIVDLRLVVEIGLRKLHNYCHPSRQISRYPESAAHGVPIELAAAISVNNGNRPMAREMDDLGHKPNRLSAPADSMLCACCQGAPAEGGVVGRTLICKRMQDEHV